MSGHRRRSKSIDLGLDHNIGQRDYHGLHTGRQTDLGDLEKEPTVFDKLKGYKKLNEEANQDIPGYFMALEDYCKKTAVHAAYVKAYTYVKAFAEQFELFFNTFV